MATAAGGMLLPPDEFPFPFQPYSIQNEFMQQIYQTLEKGDIGIFESPTGTVSGKQYCTSRFHRMRTLQ